MCVRQGTRRNFFTPTFGGRLATVALDATFLVLNPKKGVSAEDADGATAPKHLEEAP